MLSPVAAGEAAPLDLAIHPLLYHIFLVLYAEFVLEFLDVPLHLLDMAYSKFTLPLSPCQAQSTGHDISNLTPVKTHSDHVLQQPLFDSLHVSNLASLV